MIAKEQQIKQQQNEFMTIVNDEFNRIRDEMKKINEENKNLIKKQKDEEERHVNELNVMKSEIEKIRNEQKEKENQNENEQKTMKDEIEKLKKEQIGILNEQKKKEIQNKNEQKTMKDEIEKLKKEQIELLNEQKKKENQNENEQKTMKDEIEKLKKEQIELLNEQKKKENQNENEQKTMKDEIEKLKNELKLANLADEIPFTGNKFEGIIWKLGHGNPRMVISEGIVDVTASSVLGNNSGRLPEHVVEFDSDSYFYSDDIKDSWIMFDFKKNKVKISHYSIKSNRFGGKGYYHLQTWCIEGSNDKSSWKKLDTRKNEKSLDNQSVSNTFQAQNVSENDYCRYIRLRQTDVNTWGNHVILISSLEYFGSVIFNFPL